MTHYFEKIQYFIEKIKFINREQKRVRTIVEINRELNRQCSQNKTICFQK